MARRVERHLHRGSLARNEDPREARGQQSLEQLEPTAPSVGHPVGEVEWVEAQCPSGCERQPGGPHRGRQCRILPLRVEDERSTAKGQLAEYIGLDE